MAMLWHTFAAVDLPFASVEHFLLPKALNIFWTVVEPRAASFLNIDGPRWACVSLIGKSAENLFSSDQQSLPTSSPGTPLLIMRVLEFSETPDERFGSRETDGLRSQAAPPMKASSTMKIQVPTCTETMTLPCSATLSTWSVLPKIKHVLSVLELKANHPQTTLWVCLYWPGNWKVLQCYSSQGRVKHVGLLLCGRRIIFSSIGINFMDILDAVAHSGLALAACPPRPPSDRHCTAVCGQQS